MCEPLLEVLMVKLIRAGIEEKEISQRSLIYLITSFDFVTSALKPLDYRGECNSTFDSVGRCQVLLKNEICISIKLVSRRKHGVL